MPQANIKISAIDEVTRELRNINKGFDNILPRKKFINLLKESGISQVGKEVFSLGTKVALIGGLTAAGIFAIEKSTADYGAQVARTSKLVGLSTDSLQEYQFIASRVGLSNDDLSTGLKKFTKNMGDAKRGVGTLAGALKVGNPALLAQLRGTKNNDDALSLMVKTINKLPNANLKASLSTAAFGRNGFAFSNLAAQNLDKLRLRAHELGKVLSKDAVMASEEFEHKLGDLEDAANGLKLTLGGELMPVIGDLLRDLTQFVIQNRGQIVEFSKSLAKELPSAIRVCAGVLKLLLHIFGTFDEATGKFEVSWWRVKTALALVAGFMVGPLIFSIGKVLYSFGTFFSLGTRLGVLFLDLVPILEGFWTALMGPIGLAIVGITAVVLLGVYLYKKWKPFADLVDGIWAKLKTLGSYFILPTSFGVEQGASVAGTSSSGPSLLPNSPRLINGGGGGAMTHENIVKVLFPNAPKGTRVQKVKNDSWLDLSVIYSGLGAGDSI